VSVSFGQDNVEHHKQLQTRSVFFSTQHKQLRFFIRNKTYTIQINNFWSHGAIFILIWLIQTQNCPDVLWETLNRFFSKPENPHLCCSCTDPFNYVASLLVQLRRVQRYMITIHS